MIHAGGKLFGASAIEKMAKIIGGLQELERHWAVMKSYPGSRLELIRLILPLLKVEDMRPLLPMNADCRITVHFYPNENI